jgi:hypothetical protein
VVDLAATSVAVVAVATVGKIIFTALKKGTLWFPFLLK